MDKFWIDGKKRALEFTLRDHEDTVRHIVDKMKVGKEKLRRTF
jgi:hypothetical protein